MSGARRPTAVDVVARHQAVQLLVPPPAVALAYPLADGVGQATERGPEVGLFGVVGLQFGDQVVELGELGLKFGTRRVHPVRLHPQPLRRRDRPALPYPHGSPNQSARARSSRLLQRMRQAVLHPARGRHPVFPLPSRRVRAPEILAAGPMRLWTCAGLPVVHGLRYRGDTQ